jgi:hypothetical protein
LQSRADPFFWADIQQYFELYQYGVGCKAGCETVNQRALELLKKHPNHVLFKTDFSNAFKSIYRVQILRAAWEHFFGMCSFVSAVYAPLSNLFCLVVQPLLIKLDERLNGQGRTDGEVLGKMILSPDAVGLESAKLGLQLNFGKCDFFSMEG